MNNRLLHSFFLKRLKLRQHFSTQNVSQNEEKIVIPKKIPRSKTDILKALSSTVKRDFTAAHYKYIDDPYFIPYNNLSKRAYSLAKESGRKAAAYFLNEYPQLFLRNDAEPKVEAFCYKEILNEEVNIELDDLINSVATNQVENAIYAYQVLNERGEEISQDLKQSLLELVCFFNCKESPAHDYLEEKWLSHKRESKMRSWEDNNFASKLFESLEPKTSLAYSSIICGMIKHHFLDGAYELYKQSQEKNISLSIEAYNHLLSIIIFFRQSAETRWEFVIDIFSAMNEANLAPNVITFNSALEVLSKSGFSGFVKSNACKVMAEMKKINVEPSLGTYYLLLLIFGSGKEFSSSVLYEIMDEIKDKKFLKIQDKRDTYFFSNAMLHCNKDLMDVNLAFQVHEYFQENNHHHFITDAFHETIYYQNFFKLIFNTKPLEEAMEIYNLYIPNVYIPEPLVMAELLKAVELHQGYQYLPQICSDVITFDQLLLQNLYQIILEIISKKKFEESLQFHFVAVAWEVVLKIEQQFDEHKSNILWNSVSWTSKTLCQLLKIFINGNDMVKANFVLDKMIKEKDNFDSSTSDALKMYASVTLENQDFKNLIKCLKFAISLNLFKVHRFSLELAEKAKLDENIIQMIKNLVNDNNDPKILIKNSN